MRIVLPLVLLLSLRLEAETPQAASRCPQCSTWNAPQKPFQVFGNTYYVGVRGLSSILIISKEGHILIDGGLPESAALIAKNIQSLGFRLSDVKLIVNSHVHFDHAGGIAELQRLSGAQVAASPSSAAVLEKGLSGLDDPQYGVLPSFPPVREVKVIANGAVLRVGSIRLTAHSTPGHTPGGTSWTWMSCEKDRCLDVVYADSLNPVSADAFKFTRSAAYPQALADFETSFTTLSEIFCDILLTPHPEFSDLWGRLKRREEGDRDEFIDSNACRRYVDSARDRLQKRIQAEGITE